MDPVKVAVVANGHSLERRRRFNPSLDLQTSTDSSLKDSLKLRDCSSTSPRRMCLSDGLQM